MPKRAADTAKIEERRKRVAANLLGGLSYRDMAEALGCSVGTIASDVKAIMRRWQTEQVTDVQKRVAMQLRRTDRMINSIWETALGGDLAAQDRVKMWMDKQDKYIGIGGDILKVGGPNGEPLPTASPVVIYIPDNGRQSEDPDQAGGAGGNGAEATTGAADVSSVESG